MLLFLKSPGPAVGKSPWSAGGSNQALVGSIISIFYKQSDEGCWKVRQFFFEGQGHHAGSELVLELLLLWAS